MLKENNLKSFHQISGGTYFQKWGMGRECFGNHLIFGFGIVSSGTSIQEFLLLYFTCIFPEIEYASLWILIVLIL